MKIAICQMKVMPSLEQNEHVIIEHIQQGARMGADIVLFPESALTGYLGLSLDDLGQLNPSLVHQALERLRGVCAKHQIGAIVGQYFKRCGNWYNNCVTIDKRGRIIASYDKLQLVDLDCHEVTPGQGLSVFEFEGVKCSMAICHDIRYPEILRAYGASDVQVHFHLFYGVRHPRDLGHQVHYDAHLLTRAVENGFFLAAANASENEQMVRSQLVSPDGVVMAKAESHAVEMLLIDCDTQTAGDGWARKRRDDLFPLPDWLRTTGLAQVGTYFDRQVWEQKPYMIRHERCLLDGAPHAAAHR